MAFGMNTLPELPCLYFMLHDGCLINRDVPEDCTHECVAYTEAPAPNFEMLHDWLRVLEER